MDTRDAFRNFMIFVFTVTASNRAKNWFIYTPALGKKCFEERSYGKLDRTRGSNFFRWWISTRQFRLERVLIPLVRIQSWREKFFHRCEIFVGIEWINIHFTLCIGSNAMGFFFLFNNIVVFQSFLILFNKIATRIAKTWRNLRKYNQQSRLFRSIWESIFHYVFTWSSNFLNYLNSSDFTSRNFTSTNTDLKSSYSTSSGLINLNES